MDQIFSMALESGLWAALFCFLFVYMLKDSRSRETKYTTLIDTLTAELQDALSSFKLCEDIKVTCENNSAVTQAIKCETENIMEDVETMLSALERK